jgi:hypothetical protein
MRRTCGGRSLMRDVGRHGSLTPRIPGIRRTDRCVVPSRRYTLPMKCFIHRSADAIGSCRACHKGLCPECVVDHGYALSCKGTCESDVALVQSQILTSRRLLAAQKGNRYLAPGFFGVAGLVFIIQGLSDGDISLFPEGLGVLFVAFAVALLIANRRWTRG